MKLYVFASSVLALFIANSSSHRDAGAVGIQIRNVDLLLSSDIVLGIRSLRGELEPTKPSVPVTFDDSNSFALDADTGEIHITAASLSALMNQYVFADKDAPIKDVKVTLDGNELIQSGKIHKVIDIPFRIAASLSVTTDGNVRLHADRITAEHIAIKGLLAFLGKNLENLIHQYPGRGVRSDGDDLILSAAALTPAPHIRGRIIRAAVTADSIILMFGSGRHLPALKPPLGTDAYIYHRGGVLRFGKLTMKDADLEIVGDGPGVFGFFQREYQRQLVAGYSKTTPANGLVAHMVDYSHFRHPK